MSGLIQPRWMDLQRETEGDEHQGGDDVWSNDLFLEDAEARKWLFQVHTNNDR